MVEPGWAWLGMVGPGACSCVHIDRHVLTYMHGMCTDQQFVEGCRSYERGTMTTTGVVVHVVCHDIRTWCPYTRAFPSYTRTLVAIANEGNTGPHHENPRTSSESTFDSWVAGLRGLRSREFCTFRTLQSLRSHPSPLTRQFHDSLGEFRVCRGSQECEVVTSNMPLTCDA